MKNKRQYIYLLNRMVCIFRDIRVLRDQSGTEKEVDELEKQHRFCLEESVQLAKDWTTSNELRTTGSIVS